MASNPNPARITDAMWRLWTTVAGLIPGVRLGGIYAFKSGYHSTVLDNQGNWPGNYSIRLPLDLTQPDNKARAIDLTMDNRQMILRTTYLRNAALHPDDNRLNCVREFYGTLDNEFVFGLIQDSGEGNWRSSTSDTSHLWHIHISIFTEFCDDWSSLAAVASVLSGETWEQWNTDQGDDVKFTIREGDTGSVWLCDYISRRAVTSPDEWAHLQAQGIEHRGDLPPGVPASWYGVRIDLPPSGGAGGPVDLSDQAKADIRTIVDQELDEQSRAGADQD